MVIVGLAYLYNYSGMAYTLGAAAARIGPRVSIGQQLSGMGGLFSKRQRYRQQFVVRKSAGGRSTSIESESHPCWQRRIRPAQLRAK